SNHSSTELLSTGNFVDAGTAQGWPATLTIPPPGQGEEFNCCRNSARERCLLRFSGAHKAHNMPLTILIFVPLLGAAAVLLQSEERSIWISAFIFSLIPLALSFYLLTVFDPHQGSYQFV